MMLKAVGLFTVYFAASELFQTILGDRLLVVHAVWRHGDRNPVNVITTDPLNGPDTWPNGLGELTKVGIKQEYELGQILRRRYESLGIIEECKTFSEIYLRSTDYNRTLMSALVTSSGLIKLCPWNNGFRPIVSNWKPFPVHTTLAEDDYELGGPICPKADHWFEERVKKSSEYSSYDLRYKDLFEFISNVTNETIRFDNVSRIADILNIIKINNDTHTLPKWANSSIMDTLNALYKAQSNLSIKNQAVVRLIRGRLLYDIITRLKTKVKNDDGVNRTYFYGYSAHDGTLLTLLSLLGSYEHSSFFIPAYSSCILLELWKSQLENQHYVKMLYRSGVGKNFEKMQLSGCPKLPLGCPLSDFIRRNEPLSVKDSKRECCLNGLKIYNKVAFLVIIVALLLGSTLTLTGLIIRSITLNHRKYNGYNRIRLDLITDDVFINGT